MLEEEDHTLWNAIRCFAVVSLVCATLLFVGVNAALRDDSAATTCHYWLLASLAASQMFFALLSISLFLGNDKRLFGDNGPNLDEDPMLAGPSSLVLAAIFGLFAAMYAASKASGQFGIHRL